MMSTMLLLLVSRALLTKEVFNRYPQEVSQGIYKKTGSDINTVPMVHGPYKLSI